MTRTGIVKRVAPLADLLFLLLAVSIITFLLMEAAPGDPAEIRLASRFETPTAEAVADLRREMGLNDPFPVRYARWLGRVVRLDLGRSYRTGDPVAQELGHRLPATVLLAAATLAFTIFFSTLLGMAAALREARRLDRFCRLATALAVAVPDFWLGMVLVYLFSVRLRWLPAMGAESPAALVLPVATLGLSMAALHGRVFRASLLTVLKSEYIRFARMKGIPARTVLRRHVLKNALLPVLTLWGVSLGHLLGGTVIVETLFAWPGVGKLTVDAVLDRDFPLVQGGVLLMAVTFVLVSRSVDLLHRVLDPRVAAGGAG